MNSIIRIIEPKTGLDINYLPKEKDPPKWGSYEDCRRQIDQAFSDKTIKQEQKEGLIGKLNHNRNIYTIKSRSGNSDIFHEC